MIKIVIVLCFLAVLQLVHCNRYEDFENDNPCSLPRGEPGVCINIHSCKPFLELNRGEVSNPFTTWLLHQTHCGFDGNSPKTCCPLFEDDDYPDDYEFDHEFDHDFDRVIKHTTRKVAMTVRPKKTYPKTSSMVPPKSGNINWLSLGASCTTTYNTKGNCTDIHRCEPLLSMVKKARSDPAAARAVKQAHCGFSGTSPTVCCPLPRTLPVVSSKPTASNRSTDFLAAFPEPPTCGVGSAASRGAVVVTSRVAGGVPAKLGALPWMALLAYRDETVASGVRWRCGGSLISSRHVLTSAHCIHLREDKLFLVRLGELDLAREDEGATPVDVPIKTMIKHEMYSRNKPVAYDIGVLVLDRDVAFTDMIRPICLVPDKKWRSSTFEGQKPVVAGWGDTKWKGVRATHLQVAQLPVLSDRDCEKVYSKHFSDGRAFSQQALCAGYAEGQVDACAGDSGAPLMLPLLNEKSKSSKSFFYAIGVVSFGSRCAVPGVPGVYTRVAAYMPWLQEKVLGKTRRS